MNESGSIRDLDCARASRYIHQRLDGDVLDADNAEWLARHLEGCGDCRQVEIELRQIQQVLRDLGETPFPEDGIDEVWNRTTRSRGRRAWLDWRAIAAAAVLAIAILGIWQVGDRSVSGTEVTMAEPAPSEEELARATAEARFVLNLTASALRRSEQVAIEEVMGKRVSPALRKIPLLWPGQPGRSREARRNGEDDV